MVVFVDEARNRVGVLIEVLTNRQTELINYIKDTYSRVRVIVEENWMRLDFDEDGKVGLEDVKESLKNLIVFLREFDYLKKTSEISNSLYQQASEMVKGSK